MIAAELLREAAAGPLAARLPSTWMEEHALVPLRLDEGTGEVVIAAARALDPTVTDELARRFGARARLEPASPDDVQAALLAARHESAAASEESPLAAGDDAMGDLRARANDAPVVQLVNAMLADAIRTGASDVHLEAGRGALRLRMREDGVLRDVASYSRDFLAGVTSRVKLLAGLDIAERRLPQDGRARVRLGSREVDLRVSTIPSLHGEGIVLRLLDQEGALRDIAALGMPAHVAAGFEALVRQPTGLVLVSGPTGSGKTTTMYAALARRNDAAVKIVTVEDPVEYQLPGVVQVPVNRKAGLGFANALRSILRHDPDIIMIGELRDRETAEVAVQAALTGHLVLSTLHTNDAPGGVTRLVDMGIEPYLVAATLHGILAQRLVRVACPACAAPIGDDDPQLLALWMHLAHAPQRRQARRGRGCAACNGTGYRGRVGLFELFAPTPAERRLIARGSEWRDAAGAVRRTLVDHGAALVAEGITTPEEVLRVVSSDDEHGEQA